MVITTGGYNDELRRVVMVDVVALLLLAAGFIGLVTGDAGQSG